MSGSTKIRHETISVHVFLHDISMEGNIHILKMCTNSNKLCTAIVDVSKAVLFATTASTTNQHKYVCRS